MYIRNIYPYGKMLCILNIWPSRDLQECYICDTEIILSSELSKQFAALRKVLFHISPVNPASNEDELKKYLNLDYDTFRGPHISGANGDSGSREPRILWTF